MSCSHDLVFVECPRCKVPVATMPLLPEVVAVLSEAVMAMRDGTPCRAELWDAVEAFEAAGRLGLPPQTGRTKT